MFEWNKHERNPQIPALSSKPLTMASKLCILFALLNGFTLASPIEPVVRSPTWTSLAPIPLFPRQEHTTLFIPPATIAILGGIVPNNSFVIPVETTALMQFYSITNNSWTTRAPLPMELNHANAAVVDDKIYVLGGLAETDSDDPAKRAWRAVSDSWEYNPSTDSWCELPGLPDGEARGSAAVGVYDSKIYLAGGMTDLEFSANGKQQTVSVVSIYDTIRKTWIKVPEPAKYLPEGRDHAGAAVVGSKMYVLGGRIDGQNNPRDTVFVLDLCDLEGGWKTAAGKMPTPRGGVCSGVVGAKVYTFGGEGNRAVESGIFDQVEVYDTVEDKWDSAGTMKIPRHGTYAVGVGERVYIPGGGVAQSGLPVADFDVYSP
jgi:N-acetylneuraminic acid mutarotase